MKTSSLIAFILLLISISSQADDISNGKALFVSRCAACHNVNKVMTGPALRGVELRRSMEWIVDFVHSSREMVQNGDTAAVAVYKRFNNVTMPDHTDLSETDIKNIIGYIKSESKSSADSAPFAKPAKQKVAYRPIDNLYVIAVYIFVVLVLAGSLFYAVSMKNMMLQKTNSTRPDSVRQVL